MHTLKTKTMATKSEIESKIAKLEKAIASPATPKQYIPAMEKQLEGLKADLQKETTRPRKMKEKVKEIKAVRKPKKFREKAQGKKEKKAAKKAGEPGCKELKTKFRERVRKAKARKSEPKPGNVDRAKNYLHRAAKIITRYKGVTDKKGYETEAREIFEGALEKARGLKDKYSSEKMEGGGGIYAGGGKIAKFKEGDSVMVNDTGYVTYFSGFDISKPATIRKVEKTKQGYFYGLTLSDGKKPFNNAPESKLEIADELKAGGQIPSARARERKYTSQQPHEQAYRKDRVSPVRYYKKEGGFKARAAMSKKKSKIMNNGGPVPYKNEPKYTVVEENGPTGSGKEDKTKKFIREIDISLKNVEGLPNQKLSDSKQVAQVLHNIWDKNLLNVQEQFFVLFMDRQNKIIGYSEISKGGVAGTVVDPKIISALASKSLASAVIVAHNHPSGNLKPSNEDIAMTKKLKEAMKLIDVQLLDSVILTPDGNYFSFTDEGMI